MKYLYIFLFSFSIINAQDSVKNIVEKNISDIIQGNNNSIEYIFKKDSLNKISDKNFKNEITEIKNQIDETIFKFKILKDDKISLLENNFFLKEVYSHENVKIFIAVINFKINSIDETLSFQILKVDEYIGFINVHGQLVDDVIIGPEDRINKKSP